MKTLKDERPAAKQPTKFDPRKLPKNAQGVLLISIALTFAAMMLDPEPLSSVVLIALISIGAFAETRRTDAPNETRTLGQIYDRALIHALWLAASILPTVFLGIGVRRLLGLYVGQLD
jgi:hypothetical protein